MGSEISWWYVGLYLAILYVISLLGAEGMQTILAKRYEWARDPSRRMSETIFIVVFVVNTAVCYTLMGALGILA